MSRATVLSRSSIVTAHAALSAVALAAVVENWRAFNKWLFDPYRPELHYMRGPGPKWREKHAGGSFQAVTEKKLFERGVANFQYLCWNNEIAQ